MEEKIGYLIPVITTGLTIIWSVTAWYLNKLGSRKLEIFKRKEEKYSALIESMRGFYSSNGNAQLKNEFINQLNLCWMYCPDIIIKTGYEFIVAVHERNTGKFDAIQKEEFLGKLLFEIRKDLINNKLIDNTELSPSDFKPLVSK